MDGFYFKSGRKKYIPKDTHRGRKTAQSLTHVSPQCPDCYFLPIVPNSLKGPWRSMWVMLCGPFIWQDSCWPLDGANWAIFLGLQGLWGRGLCSPAPLALVCPLNVSSPSLCHVQNFSARESGERKECGTTCWGWKRSETLRRASNEKQVEAPDPSIPFPFPSHLQRCPDHFSQIQLDTKSSLGWGMGRGTRSEIHAQTSPRPRHWGATDSLSWSTHA